MEGSSAFTAFHSSSSGSFLSLSASTSSRLFSVSSEHEGGSTSASASTGRRDFMAQSSAGVFGVITSRFILPNNDSSAQASVYIDKDRYGDKELRVATVNRLRQNLRNAIVNDPSLAPLFLRLAIQDALTYNDVTGDYGPDGSIVHTVLSLDSDDASKKEVPPSLRHLMVFKPAALALTNVQANIQQTTAVTMADLVTFAGAEAMESAGGPKISIQLGKLDSKTKTTIRTGSGKSSSTGTSQKEPIYPNLSDKNNAATIIDAFKLAGLTEREVALVYGAFAALDQVVVEYVPVEVEEVEANEMGEKEVYFPSSFGAPKNIYGNDIGTMDTAIFSSILKKKTSVGDDAGVFDDEKVMAFAEKYAKKKGDFFKDFPLAYDKIMSVGRLYTGVGILESL